MVQTAMAYLDESGDLGWKLDKPYLFGGSARHFVIAIALGMNGQHRRIGKVVDKLHKAQNWTSKNEKKWATINPKARESFCQLAAGELATNPDVKVLVAVYHKDTAPHFLRTVEVQQDGASDQDRDPKQIAKLEYNNKGKAHLMYAMLVADTLADHLPAMDVLTYCPDDLNGGHRTLEHITTYRLLIQDQRKLDLRQTEFQESMQRGLTFADMCAGAVFEAYERKDERYLAILKQHISVKDFRHVVPEEQPQAGQTVMPAGLVREAAALRA